MIVNSFNTEFGYELIATLPFAYWHHLNRTLTRTSSGQGSAPYYFFSPDHRIDPSPRDFAHTNDAAKVIPNMWIHRSELDTSRWAPPPLAAHYAPRAIRFAKPTVVIYNRYNKEWGLPPINYFDLPVLRTLFKMLLPKYDVVYFNVRGEEGLEDNAHSMDLGDYAMIRREFPQVHIVHDLIRSCNEDYNTVQLRVFAGCRKFITMNGAPCILASYFGGENIIYTKRCREVMNTTGSFHGWYHLFNPKDPSHIRLVRSYEDLIAKVKAAWVDELPLLTILLRSHNRPKGFARALQSIENGCWPNVRVIASYDNEDTLSYLTRFPVTRLRMNPHLAHRPAPASKDYARWFPPNTYFNSMASLVKDGYIAYLDDDDVYEEGALKVIMDNVAPGALLLWKCRLRDGRDIPEAPYFGREEAGGGHGSRLHPSLNGQISGICMAYPASAFNRSPWEPWRRGDFRVMRNLSNTLCIKWLDNVLSRHAERIDTTLGKVRTAIGSGHRRDRRFRGR